MKFDLLLLCCTWSLAAAAYPTSYPFENESFVPEDVPAGTPSFTFDENDTGGYIYWGAFKLTLLDGTLTDDDFPYWHHKNGFAWFNLVDQYSAPPILPGSVFNCTLKDIFFSASDYTGLSSGQRVCDVGSCCDFLYGNVKFGDDQLEWHSWNNDRVSAAMCGEISEEIYCVIVGGHFQLNCMEYMVSPTERLATVFACYDSWVLYMLSCPVYKQIYQVMNVFEPALFIDTLTVELQITNDVAAFAQDRVCRPYSYYNPTASPESSTTKSTSSGSSSGSSSESAASSAGALQSVLCSLFLTSAVFF